MWSQRAQTIFSTDFTTGTLQTWEWTVARWLGAAGPGLWGHGWSVQCLREGSKLKIKNCPSEGHPSGAPRTGIQCLKLDERSISYAKIGIILQNEVTFYLF